MAAASGALVLRRWGLNRLGCNAISRQTTLGGGRANVCMDSWNSRGWFFKTVLIKKIRNNCDNSTSGSVVDQSVVDSACVLTLFITK